jgi:hypothetical protein
VAKRKPGASGHKVDPPKRVERYDNLPTVEQAFVELSRAGMNGLTSKEFAEIRRLHHGQASSALSGLHRSGTAERLKETRARAGVYVLSHLVGGRQTVPYRTNAYSRSPESLVLALHRTLKERGHPFAQDIEDPGGGQLLVTYTPPTRRAVERD